MQKWANLDNYQNVAGFIIYNLTEAYVHVSYNFKKTIIEKYIIVRNTNIKCKAYPRHYVLNCQALLEAVP